MKPQNLLPVLAVLLLVAACLPQGQTQQATTPLAETLSAQPDTPEPLEAVTSSPVPTTQPMLTFTPSSTITAASAPQSLQTSTWRWIRMFDPKASWGVHSDGTVFHMAADSEGWQEVTPTDATLAEQVLTSFLDPQRAWIIYHGDPIPMKGPWKVWHTVNGGQTWTQASIEPATQEGLDLTEIFFVDPDNGWLMGQIYPGMNQVFAVLYATTDGGDTWQVISSPMPPTGPTETGLRGSYSLSFGSRPLTFISPRVGFTGGDSLYKTEDAGMTWQAQQLVEPPDLPALEQPFSYISPPRFSTAGSGIFQYLVFDFNEVFCPPCDIFASLPAAAYLYHTHDGGETWTPNPAPGLIGMAGMLDADTAWFLGREQASQSTTNLYLSRDQGATWTVQAQDTILPLGTRLYFTSGETGFAYNPFLGQGFTLYQVPDMVDIAGQEAYFYFTEDTGATWAPFPLAYP